MIGSGLFHKVHSKNKYDNDVADVEDFETKSSLASVYNPLSTMGSASCDKIHDKSRDDNVVSDIEHARTK